MPGRLFLILLDGVGVGELPDAADYGDEGANTFLHVAEKGGPLRLPNLTRLGMGNIQPAPGVEPSDDPLAAFARLRELSPGKDTTAGHWELAGVVLDNPFPVFPDGFPPELIGSFEEKIGREMLGNRPASGTVILDELGEEHVRTGKPIVYTSADSVFQIAAHEDVIPLEELYRQCRIARELLTGPWAVARVIARPFAGKPGAFRRTGDRKDFSLAPTGHTVFQALEESGIDVYGIGKIEDIYTGVGITRSVHTADNKEGMDRMEEAMADAGGGAAFVNLNDFDSKWGHRNDPESFARGLEVFDARLPSFLSHLREEDLLLITSDHGTDPTTPGTDHTREHIFLLAVGHGIPTEKDLGVRRTFADVAATIARHFNVDYECLGTAVQV